MTKTKKMTLFIAVALIAVLGVGAVIGITSYNNKVNAAAYAANTEKLTAARTEVLNYQVEAGTKTQAEADNDFDLYCGRIGAGQGACRNGTDGSSCGSGLACLNRKQYTQYIAERKAYLDAQVESGALTQEQADALYDEYCSLMNGRCANDGDGSCQGNSGNCGKNGGGMMGGRSGKCH